MVHKPVFILETLDYTQAFHFNGRLILRNIFTLRQRKTPCAEQMQCFYFSNKVANYRK